MGDEKLISERVIFFHIVNSSLRSE